MKTAKEVLSSLSWVDLVLALPAIVAIVYTGIHNLSR